MNSQEVLRDLLGGASGVFSPIAYYDQFMDTIRVEFRDCSTYEVRINETLTLIKANHPENEDEASVGLVIKGIGHLFNELGLPIAGVLRVVDLINRLIEKGLVQGDDEGKIIPMKQAATVLGLRVDFAEAA